MLWIWLLPRASSKCDSELFLSKLRPKSKKLTFYHFLRKIICQFLTTLYLHDRSTWHTQVAYGWVGNCLNYSKKVSKLCNITLCSEGVPINESTFFSYFSLFHPVYFWVTLYNASHFIISEIFRVYATRIYILILG